MSRPVKRSLTLNGHRTSVSLEDEFWRALRRIAEAEGRTINELAAEIDADRGAATGLATAIRLFVLSRLEAQVASARPAADRPGAQRE